MKYVFDTSAFVTIFRNYYRSRFPSLWKKFDRLVVTGRIISTREVKREIEVRDDSLNKWAEKNKELFPTPTSTVAYFVSMIFEFRNFQNNVERKKMYKGGYVADPFVVATAKSLKQGSVVTLESYREHGAKVPNMCEYLDVSCLNLEEFMEEEGWKF